MEALIEQKGKPCCINMITENDKKFLIQLEKDSKKRPKTGDAEDQDQESEEELDEIDMMIQKEE
jgi:hypothetical protein